MSAAPGAKVDIVSSSFLNCSAGEEYVDFLFLPHVLAYSLSF